MNKIQDAETRFRAALKKDAEESYLLAAYADFCSTKSAQPKSPHY
ncbi:MAG: hypothetical protein WCE88_03320 [Burkholderiales bacterium]